MEKRFKWIKNFISRILLLVFLIEIFPSMGNNKKSFVKVEKASAFSTQLDAIAPGYIIRQEKEGITFDLSNRLFDTMTVESFKFRNADPNKRKDDKEETMLDDDNTIWVSKDILEHGNLYEIEAQIHDSETDTTVKHINHFKYIDKNKAFRPKLEFADGGDRGKFFAGNLVLDLQNCKDLVDKSENIDIEILNSDLSKTTLNRVSTTSSATKSSGYRISFDKAEGVIQINKDYVVRVSFDGKVWDSLLSGVVKADPKVHEVLSPTDYYTTNPKGADFPNIPGGGVNIPKGNITFNKSTRELKISTAPLKLGSRSVGSKIKIILTSDNPGLRAVEVEGDIDNTDYVINVPEEYLGKDEPANLRFVTMDIGGDRIVSDVMVQIGLKSDSSIKVWTGMKFTAKQQLLDGFKVDRVRAFDRSNSDETQYLNIPHSWDGFPRVHYITLYDGSRVNQIGGEYRFDVIKSKEEFVGSPRDGKEHDVAGCNFKIKYEDMKQGFNTFYFKVESSNQYRDWAYAYVPLFVYADIVKVDSLEFDIKNITESRDGYNFTISPINFKPQLGEKMSIIDDEGKEHFSSESKGKDFNFNNVPLILGGKYIAIYKKTSSLLHFNSIDSSILFNPVIVGTEMDGQQGIEILIDEKISGLINGNPAWNTLKILHMNGNPTGNQFSDITKGSNRRELNTSLTSGTYYIAELSNGSESFRTTFEYTPLKLNLTSITGTTAKLEWNYPNNYLMMEGDALNIYFKKDGYDYPAVPDAKIVHGFQGMNFDNVRTYTLKSLSPNVNYTAKLELVTSQGVKFSGEVEFVTSNFKIIDEKILGLSEEGTTDQKKLEVVWDLNQADVEFSRGDKIDVFLKLKSHDSFPKTPHRTITEDIYRVKRAEIEVPNYNESYSVRVVYTIGGVRHSSKTLNFRVELGGFEASVKDITDSTAVVEWTYPENVEFFDGQGLKFLMKRTHDIDYTEVKNIQHGGGNDISKINSHTFENLQSDCSYLVKIQYKIGEKVVADFKEDIVQEQEVEFTTNKFSVKNASTEGLEGRKAKVKWEVSNEDYLYAEGDKIEVYIKQKSMAAYNNVVFSASENLKSVKSAEFDVDFNVDYDVKVAYTIKGKEVAAYTSYKLELASVELKIDSITENQVKLSWEYPKNYKIQDKDAVYIWWEQQDNKDSNSITKRHGFDENGAYQQINDYKTQTINLKEGKTYRVKFQFFYGGAAGFMEQNYYFKAVPGLQILNLELDGINSTSMLLKWSVYNQNMKFSGNDKIEIFVKEKDKSKNDDSDDGFSEAKISKTGDELNSFYDYTVDELEVGKKYIFRVKYTIPKKDNTFSEGDSNGGSDDPQVVYQDIEGEPNFSKLDFHVVDADATSVKLEVVYPEGYETVDNDILDMFIKNDKDGEYKATPDFSIEHGKDDIDLNETTVFDIAGLSPNTDYKVKVVFWKRGGLVKEERERTFKTGDVGGIGDVVVVGVMDYVAEVGIKMDPEDLLFSSEDYCKVYIKKKGEEQYPEEPNGEVLGDVFNDSRVVTSYFEELNTEYDIKAVVRIGGKEYEKFGEFVSKVDDLNIEVKEINPMTAQVEWRYPDNYTLVDGESVKIYIKYKEDEEYPDEPDLELVQSDELILSDVNLVELSALVPETEYEVKVQLSLLEANLPDVIKEFTTGTFTIEDLKIRTTTDNGVAISWEIDTEEVNFVDGQDDFSIFIKDSSESDYDFDNPVASFTEGLNELRTASFTVDEGIENVDILVSYLIENFETYSEVKFNPIKLNVGEDKEGILAEWVYPSDIKFEDGDRVDIYLKNLDDGSGYPMEPVFRFVQGTDGDLLKTTSAHLGEIEPGTYMLKFLLLTGEISYSPIEVKFETGLTNLGYAVIRLEIQKNDVGRSIIIGNGEELDINYEKKMKTDPEGLGVEGVADSPDVLKITNLVPGKLYKSILIYAVNNSGEEVTFGVENVKIDAETLLQQFLTNIYKFAFERFPDEGGYSFWLQKLLEKGEITGKYVVHNLMFAEKEFSERNLPDDELIKVLYQIVVNREYDEGGLQYWIKEYNETYLPQNNNDSFEAQKAIVMRMLHEQEFRNLCETMGILW